jgi:hypothetical protein
MNAKIDVFIRVTALCAAFAPGKGDAVSPWWSLSVVSS